MSRKELKNELKAMSSQIREDKADLKKYQQENDGWDNGRFHAIEIQKYEFRHKHIAYGLLRGLKYEQIENHCSDDHSPNFAYIKELTDGHQEKAVEDVRACA
jgi:hypothetical protein